MAIRHAHLGEEDRAVGKRKVLRAWFLLCDADACETGEAYR